MMNAHARLVVASSAFTHALPPNPKLSSSIRSRCTPRRPSLPMPSLRQLPTTLQATKTLHPTTTPVVTADRAAGSFAGTDRFHVIDFHHVEFWCADATSAAGGFSFALGVPLAAHSDLTTGNTAHASHLLRSRSGPLAFPFTAPYARHISADDDADATAAASNCSPVVPSFSADAARRFAANYGLAVRAVAVRVSDAAEAFRASVAAGARPAFSPAELGRGFVFAEVELYGDAVLRFVSYPADTDVAFLPGFESVVSSSECPDYGLNRFDHIVGGVPDLAPVAAYIAGFTGFHEFDRVNGDEIGTAESSLNGLVLANSSENVLLTLLGPVQGTKRRSQIQTFLDHHGGPGVQHLAMTSDYLLGALGDTCAAARRGVDVLSEAQINECQELGVRVDRADSGGVVLQTFTKAAGDRPTLLLEFIQRIGCVEIDENGKEYQRGGCGGFAKDNVIHLVKSIEDYDKTLDAPVRVAS
ncbi:unnamed protein product [Miscanthus lutarioriparius]|uniref:VOC domain-containing protein n=1 Tax=Miscanthus lutarioriparius TaxID=422564 RepID=A0A811N7S5_9POAL|nr:unnamed protein product [Miscanthus lutarioriparius]